MRYVAMARRPRAWRDEQSDGWQDRPSITVIEAEREPQDIGIVDMCGTPFYRVPDVAPLGFCTKGDKR